jgi:type IV pilus assembly protein PilE
MCSSSGLHDIIAKVKTDTLPARGHGFTLIELMVAVAIVAILATIALPSYNDYILRSHLVSATNGLGAAQAQMEQYFQDNRAYNTVGTAVPPCSTASAAGPDFSIACTVTATWTTNPTATGYLLTATGTAGGVTAGFSYTLDNNGNQTSVAGSVWGSTACTHSWILKRTAAGSC